MTKIKGSIILITLSLALISIGCREKQMADLIIHNARLYTVDDSMHVLEAMAVKNGKILATGTSKEILKSFDAGQIVDMGQKAVFPGLSDAHCHFAGYATSLTWAWLGEAQSLEEMLETVSRHATAHPESPWILGRGWDHNNWPGNRMPTRSFLDSISMDKPIMLVRTDGHAIAVNTKVLEMAGILDPVAVWRTAEVLVDASGPNGILLENVADRIKAMVPPQSREEKVTALMQAEQNCFAVGLTSVHDAGLSYKTVRLIDSLQQAGQLRMNVNAMLSPSKQNFDEFVYNGIYTTNKLSVRSVKLYADGALGSRGALLKEDYSDSSGYKGITVTDADSMHWTAKVCYELGYQVCTHAIGDSANKLILDIYASILREQNDFRWRIEHAQVVDPDDMLLFKDYSIIPSVNTVHATSDMGWAHKRLGPERMNGAYAYRDLLSQNTWLCNGSDFPVEPINPLYGFHAAVSRKDRNGSPAAGFRMENSLEREDALRAMTIWAAKAAFEEDRLGSLEAGKDANFVVLDQDIMTIPAEDTYKARVLETWMDGKLIYQYLNNSE